VPGTTIRQRDIAHSVTRSTPRSKARRACVARRQSGSNSRKCGSPLSTEFAWEASNLSARARYFVGTLVFSFSNQGRKSLRITPAFPTEKGCVRCGSQDFEVPESSWQRAVAPGVSSPTDQDDVDLLLRGTTVRIRLVVGGWTSGAMQREPDTGRGRGGRGTPARPGSTTRGRAVEPCVHPREQRLIDRLQGRRARNRRQCLDAHRSIGAGWRPSPAVCRARRPAIHPGGEVLGDGLVVASDHLDRHSQCRQAANGVGHVHPGPIEEREETPVRLSDAAKRPVTRI